MKLKVTKKAVSQFLVLLPFLLIFTGSVFQNTYKIITTLCKLAGFSYMIFYVISSGKVNKNLIYVTIPFIPLLVYGVLNSFSIKAGIADGLRYLFPIVILHYGYAIKEHFGLLLKFVIAFVVLNFLVQIVNYANWLRGVNQWFYYTTEDGFIHFNQTAGIMRATGTVVFFGFFGFFNMIAFFLINKFYQGPYKRIFLGISLFGLAASLSYKAFGAFFIVLIIYYYKHIYKVLASILILLLVIFISFPDKINTFGEDIILRLSLYVTKGDSARSESYRVMFNEIADFNLFGRGVGVFGGPASTDYGSTFYKLVSFNWYDTKWLNLATTDTYLPHLFVELGLVGGFSYLLILITPLLRKKINQKYIIVAVIYFCLCFDMLFSFSLNNLEYLLFSLVFVYPIYYYENNNFKVTNKGVE